MLARHHRALLAGALLVRLVLVVYGTYQDEWFAVKYSDIDYAVVTDGSRFLALGQSPYLRDTFRYSPLLAVLLVPNVLVHPGFGKLVFVGFDFAGGWATRGLAEEMGFSPSQAKACELAFLFNPLSIAMSTRGSGDGIVCALVIGTVLCLLRARQSTGWLLAGAVLHGFSVHWRLYPIIFAPTVLVFLPDWTSRIKFGLTSFFVFAALLQGFYLAYGWEFVWETYLYHLVRKDVRHNFSVWFYATYLETPHLWLASFLPQLAVQGAIIARFARRRQDVLFCFALQTWAFVLFNKVVTAQYFLWYFALLPIVLLLQQPGHSAGQVVGKVLLPWTAAQLAWLACAYRIEFLGQTSGFELVFASGVGFFLVNVHCMCALVRGYPPLPQPEKVD